ncbi:hypothetical protein [Sutcliffiella horikoshii]|uniref:Lipoprotein n=1 Tax=Sutcliffiella horikoshii TaxID=79883 RepID=A0A5D4T769_9BACI|nr:hypothetical protein [Sutcliffiella horikoshii]TYS71580.1 hypothetical protein FZC75_13645 [Sutcliffiella horikoshii]
MKQLRQILIVITVMNFLAGCAPKSERLEVECNDTEVPCIMIISGSDKVQAVRGTTSWDSFEADSEVPPQIVSYQEGKVKAKLNSEIEIQFSRKPNSFEVYQWNDEKREKVIPILESTFVADKSGIVIYEIKADWIEGYAYYAFEINVD